MVADADDGDTPNFRRGLEARQAWYVVAVRTDFRVSRGRAATRPVWRADAWLHKTGMGALLPLWHIMKNDRRVSALPKDSILRHDCPALTVAIERKSINHLFIIRDPSIISK